MRTRIASGKATWAGHSLAACQAYVDRYGLRAFLREMQDLMCCGMPVGRASRGSGRGGWCSSTDYWRPVLFLAFSDRALHGIAVA